MLLVQPKAKYMYFASVATTTGRKLLSMEDRGHALNFAAAAVKADKAEMDKKKWAKGKPNSNKTKWKWTNDIL